METAGLHTSPAVFTADFRALLAGKGAETVGGGRVFERGGRGTEGIRSARASLTRRLLGQQAENGYTGLSSDVDLAIDHEWSDELISTSDGVATACRLVAVVKLVL
jgi:hypothetical protein